MDNEMVRVYDSTSGVHITVPEKTTFLCGMTGTIDPSCGYPAYRCDLCNAIEGSVGMPLECREIKEAHELFPLL